MRTSAPTAEAVNTASAAGAAKTASAAAGGFTLIEMLVAMLILSLVGLTLARFQTFQLAGTASLGMSAGARLQADNRAIDVLAAPGAPLAAETSTEFNAGREWTTTITPGPPPDPAAMPDLVRVDISVASAGGGPPLATRTLLRPRGEQRGQQP
ncbi:type II secretion system protein [Sandaracinobacteroides hominis]|uniref:type II secretion system protein n=1 Tax=Sandaracinobacteroides hominis TaxID=2780086 RepID=UPI0018F6DB80|nr:type II secretion system protein [Sandaracinobacteroides hominis]